MGSARATTLYARGPTPGVATRRASIAAAAAVSVFALSACSSLKDQAKEDFSSDFNCPTDRMEIKERPDLSRSSFQKAPVPPKEIADDPGRLAVWSKNNEPEVEKMIGEKIIGVRGCDHTQYYHCYRSQSGPLCVSEIDATGKIPW